MRKLSALVLIFYASSLGLYSQGQGIGSIAQDIEGVISMLESLHEVNRNQETQLQALSELLDSSEETLTVQSQTIKDSKSLIETQGEYLNRLSDQLRQQEAISSRQSEALRGALTRSKRLTVYCAVLGGTSAGLLAWGLCRK